MDFPTNNEFHVRITQPYLPIPSKKDHTAIGSLGCRIANSVCLLGWAKGFDTVYFDTKKNAQLFKPTKRDVKLVLDYNGDSMYYQELTDIVKICAQKCVDRDATDKSVEVKYVMKKTDKMFMDARAKRVAMMEVREKSAVEVTAVEVTAVEEEPAVEVTAVEVTAVEEEPAVEVTAVEEEPAVEVTAVEEEPAVESVEVTSAIMEPKMAMEIMAKFMADKMAKTAIEVREKVIEPAIEEEHAADEEPAVKHEHSYEPQPQQPYYYVQPQPQQPYCYAPHPYYYPLQPYQPLLYSKPPQEGTVAAMSKMVLQISPSELKAPTQLQLASLVTAIQLQTNQHPDQVGAHNMLLMQQMVMVMQGMCQ